jgi:lysophospholipase L1-like esterase
MITTKDRGLVRRLSSKLLLGGALAVAVLAAYVSVLAQGPRGGERWVGTWATAVMLRVPPSQTPPGQVQASQAQAPQGQVAAAPQGQPPTAGGPGGQPAAAQGLAASPLDFSNQTLRQIVHVSLGGEQVRVVFSNAYGTAPLQIGAAHVALRAKDAAIVPQSARPLMFSGSPSATIPPGALLVSDPVSLTVPALADLAIDLHLPANTDKLPVTVHAAAWQTGYVSGTGNFSGVPAFPVQATTDFLRGQLPSSSWFFLSRVEVVAPEQAGAVVTLGDSITDGTQSGNNANNRWPDHLARRFAQANIKLGVLNVGIGGNRVLSDGNGISALARFDRDVLAQTGVSHVILFEGINDIQGNAPNPPSSADLIAAHRQIIERAHARGLRIFGATLTPFGGAGAFTPEKEVKRQALNQWIRTGKMYDGVIDFEAAVRDPKEPVKIRSEFDPGDHLHMNGVGYKAMADIIDLALFSSRAVPRRTR